MWCFPKIYVDCRRSSRFPVLSYIFIFFFREEKNCMHTRNRKTEEMFVNILIMSHYLYHHHCCCSSVSSGFGMKKCIYLQRKHLNLILFLLFLILDDMTTTVLCPLECTAGVIDIFLTHSCDVLTVCHFVSLFCVLFKKCSFRYFYGFWLLLLLGRHFICFFLCVSKIMVRGNK